MLVDLIWSASIFLLNIFCPQNNFAQCRKIAVKIEFNNKKPVWPHCWGHMSVYVSQKSKWMGTTRNTCGLSYSRGLKGCWRRVSPRCSSYSSSSPWSRELLMCQAPLVLLGQIMSFSQVTTVCVCIFFFSVTIFIFSQGKALPVVPLRNLCARSSPSRFPRLPQVQGWHWRMWWLSQLAWDGGSICFEYVGFI